ncbi:MAG: hypothetical protein ABSF03_11390 [Streptosporangiaceae bacterium]|jgi:hypothetical protein
MTDDRVGVAARAAASQLSAQYGPRLEAQVAAALYARGDEQPTRQFIDPVELGSLIVSIAGLAWQIYDDRRKQRQKPTAEELARAVRVEQRTRSDLTGFEEKVIEIVAVEIIKAVDGDE